MNSDKPPVIDYEGSDYQTSFWDQGGREYEDRAEQIALRRLLPDRGELLLEVGAGAGRNTPRYAGFQRVVLLDYSLTQLQQARQSLGQGEEYLYVAGDVYRLPFVDQLFDGATMIRTLHHMQEPLTALGQIHRVLQSGSPFILEFANKQNLKAILRYLLDRQDWNPFNQEPVEFVELNFDFHPRAIRRWLAQVNFQVERQLTVSHFRIDLLKKTIPTDLLVWLDSVVQLTGNWWQLSPSVFLRATALEDQRETGVDGFFKCPQCGELLPEASNQHIRCRSCQARYPLIDGIYDFRLR